MGNSTLINNTQDNGTDYYYEYYYENEYVDDEDVNNMNYWVNGVCLTVLCVIGITTNFLNIIAMSSAVKKRKLPAYKIILAMSVADFMIMIMLLSVSIAMGYHKPFSHFEWEDIGDTQHIKHIFSQLYHLPTNAFMMISNWCAVLLGIFRLIAVFLPLQAQSLCTASRVHFSIIFIYVMGFINIVPQALILRYDENGTISQNDNGLGTLSLVISLPLPIVLCCVLTSLLGWRLSRSNKNLQFSIRKEQQATRRSEQHQITVTLILVCIFFLIINTPNVVYWALRFNHKLQEDMGYKNGNMFYTFANFFTYIGYASNFFIYIIFNSAFREHFKSSLQLSKSTSSRSSSFAKTASSSVTKAHHRGDEYSTTPLTSAKHEYHKP